MPCKESAPWCSSHISNALWFVEQWLLRCTADRGTVTVTAERPAGYDGLACAPLAGKRVAGGHCLEARD